MERRRLKKRSIMQVDKNSQPAEVQDVENKEADRSNVMNPISEEKRVLQRKKIQVL